MSITKKSNQGFYKQKPSFVHVCIPWGSSPTVAQEEISTVIGLEGGT
jgi:hypothetical protein